MGMNPVSDNYVISVMAKEKTPKKAETAPDEQLEMESVDLKSLVSQPEENGLLMAVPAKIPVLALRDVIIFPYMIFPVLVGRETSLSATMSSMPTALRWVRGRRSPSSRCLTRVTRQDRFSTMATSSRCGRITGTTSSRRTAGELS